MPIVKCGDVTPFASKGKGGSKDKILSQLPEDLSMN